MSICYDFQKWIMISLSSIAISLTIGLVSLVHGQETELQPLQPDSSQQTITTNNDSAIRGWVCFQGTDLCFEYYPKYTLRDYEAITQYCVNHADKILNGENPVQNLCKMISFGHLFTMIN